MQLPTFDAIHHHSTHNWCKLQSPPTLHSLHSYPEKVHVLGPGYAIVPTKCIQFCLPFGIPELKTKIVL
jgi:hypothetical protein